MGLPKGLALQKKLFNKKYAVEKRPKRWARDPDVKKTYYKHKKKRKKPKKHTVKTHTRGGSCFNLPHGSHFIGGTFGNDSQQVVRGKRNTYFPTRIKQSKRRRADFQGRLQLKAGRMIG